MARTNTADLLARIATLEALIAKTPSASEASEHFKAADIPVKCCDRTFKTTKGRDWHIANFKHGK